MENKQPPSTSFSEGKSMKPKRRLLYSEDAECVDREPKRAKTEAASHTSLLTNARFSNDHIVVCTQKPDCPCCNFGAVGDVIQSVTEVSKDSVKGSSRAKNKTVSNLSKEQEGLQVLHDIVYGFCEKFSLSESTRHYAFSISMEYFKYLQPSRMQGKKSEARRRIRQSREAFLAELAAASILISSRNYNSGITLRQLSKESKVESTYIIRRKSAIEAFTDIKGTTQWYNHEGVLARTCKLLELPSEQISAVQTVANRVTQLDEFQSSQPATVVAGCIYFVLQVTGMTCSKKEIHDVTCVTWKSIRNLYSRILPKAEDLLPEDLKNKFAPRIKTLRLLKSG